jgi:hypothetical protein
MKNSQSDRLDALLSDTPGILGRTAVVVGNREVDLHPCVGQRRGGGSLNNKVCVIGGASRGIGQGMAVRFAIAGAYGALPDEAERCDLGPHALPGVEVIAVFACCFLPQFVFSAARMARS